MNTKSRSAWETWKDAGREFAKSENAKNKSIIELGEASFTYAASEGLPHQEIIRLAFREGFFEVLNGTKQDRQLAQRLDTQKEFGINNY